MEPTSNLLLFGIPGLGMFLVSVLAIAVWRRASGAEFKWFWAGAGLWALAVALKVAFSLLANQVAVGFLKRALSRPLFLTGAGLYLGAVSAAFELGLVWLAGRRWGHLGRDAGRAVAVGVGAGAFEALLLGVVSLGIWVAVAMDGADAKGERNEVLARATATPLFWLVPPAERIIALLGHASTRGLVLLGVAGRRPWMVLWGFAVFTLMDGIAGVFLLSQEFAGRSMWWLELAVLPFALTGVAILVFCIRRRDEPNLAVAEHPD
ncbi:YhfC family glutamic-type intramembrane protease [Singulisphaera acidiphila]|uniref:Putative membrane protein (DUF2324) n=1 Tax=Singulisphaera acidiphila (strain ATCC BAA-1392 / DSM 18658 / VKM B-2454 / MOB10) TaxID=886293 RepID=L0DJH6_SINAD|nr:YhfC family glutamic-type intramembrane protease [Singulisphaera acidiphila]AGA28821.1 putative membrane protein (DUF2324) [Singulisphaera acidiphila DSM 18658]